jgi:hypothetical protein
MVPFSPNHGPKKGTKRKLGIIDPNPESDKRQMFVWNEIGARRKTKTPTPVEGKMRVRPAIGDP